MIQWKNRCSEFCHIYRENQYIYRKNIMEDLESESLSHTIVRKLLSDLKEEFGRGYNKTIKVAELKKMKQESRTIEEFV